MSFFVGVSFTGVVVGATPAAAGFADDGVTPSPTGAGVTPGGGVDAGVAVGAGVGVSNHPGGYVLSPPLLDDDGDFVVPTSANTQR